MNRVLKVLGVAAALALWALTLHAQRAGNGPVETLLEARKVTHAADGKETLAAARTVKPGDVIEYVVTYRNNGAEPVSGLEATLPIPPQTEFIPGSPRPAAAKASLDARAFGEIPLKRTAVREGRQVVEAVPYREYRYLRWYPGDLGAGKSLVFRARVKVIE
jgi:uncharacterized repeat protein (TIGR01451 family)